MLSQTNVGLIVTRRNKFSVLNDWTAFLMVWLTCKRNVTYIVYLFVELKLLLLGWIAWPPLNCCAGSVVFPHLKRCACVIFTPGWLQQAGPSYFLHG